MEDSANTSLNGFDFDCEICCELYAEMISVNGICPPDLLGRAVTCGRERLAEHIRWQHGPRIE